MKIFSLYEKLKKDSFSLFYLGEFDDDLTEVLMRIQETSSEEGRSIKKRVSYLIAECFQNIIRHSDEEKETDLGDSSKFFMMRNTEGVHYLGTANPVEEKNQSTLVQSLESLQNLTSEELKRIYLNALGNNALNAKGGGGLGLIEMARKTKNPPSYQFEKINEEYVNFFMQLKMKGKSESDNDESIQGMVEFYEELLSDKIVMLRKGDFSQESILPLFKLFESNLQLKKEDLVFKKKSLYIMIELLQNMNRHAVSINGTKEGMFVIGLDKGVYKMQTGNFITKDKAKDLKMHLDSLVGLDKIQLAKRYKQQLMENTISEDQGAGIGIIEMFRQSDGEILFDFQEVDENLAFYSFSATL
ncbi:MAG: SiaB family protein kinase [Crocinitomicaceae bacterium]